ncbi:2-keto-4-pentenoate hydratase [Azospirillum picis]|uniref:2-keto-4-pentenoate hydratase n=1 Tax=Azospirillum picis TaxID=488438 RepID=A0ABU0MCW2_9PROT|nr:fumarylacetoacetate hydrolase family protein [Azospirillum picis]MBP2297715.1 2-keto-4-pentenoate hydratase [Azospirillum picis]MDQ0531262.1 2-keto-4-pentenoate hydratase [Azospirillum picis]
MTMTAEAVAEAAAALLAARRDKRPLDMLPAAAMPADKADAYAIQTEVARRIGPVTAWKVGASGPGAEPSSAPIHAETLFSGVETLHAAMFRVIGIEAEIVYRLKSDLPARDEPWTREEVLDAVGSLHPAFEICDTRYATYGSLGPLASLADQGNHGALVVGPAAADWRGIDPVTQPLTLDIDGERRIDVVGGNKAGDPIRLLAWLANAGARPFGGLHAGDTVTTGSCTGTIFIAPGSRAVADFPGLGRIALTVA